MIIQRNYTLEIRDQSHQLEGEAKFGPEYYLNCSTSDNGLVMEYLAPDRKFKITPQEAILLATFIQSLYGQNGIMPVAIDSPPDTESSTPSI
jgi:hypothetical protein